MRPSLSHCPTLSIRTITRTVQHHNAHHPSPSRTIPSPTRSSRIVSHRSSSLSKPPRQIHQDQDQSEKKSRAASHAFVCSESNTVAGCYSTYRAVCFSELEAVKHGHAQRLLLLSRSALCCACTRVQYYPALE